MLSKLHSLQCLCSVHCPKIDAGDVRGVPLCVLFAPLPSVSPIQWRLVHGGPWGVAKKKRLFFIILEIHFTFCF